MAAAHHYPWGQTGEGPVAPGPLADHTTGDRSTWPACPTTPPISAGATMPERSARCTRPARWTPMRLIQSV